MREGLNEIRPYFKTGLPQYNVLPFDPFYAKEISAKRGVQNFGFTLTLRNVSEHGWSLSKVTKFVANLKNYKVHTHTYKRAHTHHLSVIVRLHVARVTCNLDSMRHSWHTLPVHFILLNTRIADDQRRIFIKMVKIIDFRGIKCNVKGRFIYLFIFKLYSTSRAKI